MAAAGPQGVSRLIPQVHGLTIGQVGDASYLELSILVETIQRDMISHLWREALLFGKPPGAADNFDVLAAGRSHRHS